MENSLKAIITPAQSIIILLPKKPFFDQVAAALGLYLSLGKQKDVSVVSSSPMTVEFNRLIGVNKITQDIGNKNLVISFSNYESSDIERVSYDIENKQFRLTVIPKPAVKAPTKDQVELSYSGITSDLVILVGGMNESHFPLLLDKQLENTQIIHVGTSNISVSKTNVVSFAQSLSSTAELMALLIQQNDLPLDSDVATNLLLGIEQASSGFNSEQVTAQTFRVVADLLTSGGKRQIHQPQPLNPNDFPQGSIPSQSPIAANQQNEDKTQSAKYSPQQQDVKQTYTKVPQDWLQKPKIYKGSNNNTD